MVGIRLQAHRIGVVVGLGIRQLSTVGQQTRPSGSLDRTSRIERFPFRIRFRQNTVFRAAQVGNAIGFLSPVAFLCRAGSLVRDDSVGIQPSRQIELQIGGYGQTRTALVVRTVIQFIENIVVKKLEIAKRTSFLKIEILAVFIKGRQCPGRFIGILHRLQFLLVVTAGGNISVHLQRHAHPVDQVGIQIQIGGITFVVIVPNHVVVAGITDGSIVGRFLGTTGYADGMGMRHGVFGQQVEPVGIDGFETAYLLLELFFSQFMIV